MDINEDVTIFYIISNEVVFHLFLLNIFLYFCPIVCLLLRSSGIIHFLPAK
jgi:hypothetical protein